MLEQRKIIRHILALIALVSVMLVVVVVVISLVVCDSIGSKKLHTFRYVHLMPVAVGSAVLVRKISMSPK